VGPLPEDDQTGCLNSILLKMGNRIVWSDDDICTKCFTEVKNFIEGVKP
jgi:hypothetical protein